MGGDYMKKENVITILLCIVMAGAGFFGGMKYQELQRGPSARQFGAGQMMGLRGSQNNNGGPLRLSEASRQGFRPVAGEILSSDATSVTVKLADGSSKIIILTDKTTINKAATGTKDDLKAGITVAVFGSENADGTVTAQSIQLNPQLRMGGPREGSVSGTPTP